MAPRSPETAADPTAFLPLRPVELLILTVLGSGDRHGYAIRKEVLDSTQGRVSIEAGNLYRYIRGLEDDGFVVDAPARGRDADDRRIYYRLTPLGRRVLAAELERLRSLVRHAEAQGLIARSRA
jgi:DNA-binding PadR family transcriptional regulator